MGRMAFDLDDNRIARESNVTEREAIRRYNWLVRKDKEIPVRAELAELTKQIGAWPAARTVERTIPQIHFASVRLRNRAREAVRRAAVHRGN